MYNCLYSAVIPILCLCVVSPRNFKFNIMELGVCLFSVTLDNECGSQFSTPYFANSTSRLR